MAMKAKILGREALSRRLQQLAPEAEKAATAAKIEIARDAAMQMAVAAPRETGQYAESIKGGFLHDNIAHSPVGVTASKDPEATGVFAHFTWRFLEFGTKAHMIKSKDGGPLAFKGATDDTEFASQVKHTGSAAHPHIFPTWRAMKPKAMRKMRGAINKAVRKAMGK